MSTFLPVVRSRPKHVAQTPIMAWHVNPERTINYLERYATRTYCSTDRCVLKYDALNAIAPRITLA